ncbi:CPBP family intramembrane glutamic endopeptidase [Chitinophaga nivalis]|uniref:CPBP family intramembrane metalloprotease n=1 Tax=Chitinophaga nivalis TaxID=2991709 RepID=A0ABT3ITD9_9BACT|nr:CPBP family intramembrane glutamic endopeptidase [Chitinophaga nivalis]MCW3463064.1 CPBP family intramembrane metalloprotease [Chitinophaga nivalis]MCW3487246.1 CPBP family intramembrane metalloprotease [Chitinophaga nivalis]
MIGHALLNTLCTVLLTLLLMVPWLPLKRKSARTAIWLFAGIYLLNEWLMVVGSALQEQWYPALGYNWLGKGVSLVVTLLLIPLVIRTKQPYAAAGLRLSVVPGSVPGCVLIGVGLLLLKAYFNYTATGTELVTAERWWYQATLPGLQEELLFRGVYLWLAGIACNRSGKEEEPVFSSRVILFIAVLFALGHSLSLTLDTGLHFNPFAFAVALLSGWVYTWIRVKSGSLLLPVLFHNLINIGITVAQVIK